jgi:hypothetical protein
MSFESIISFLSHSIWGVLGVLLVVLGAAFVACFPENALLSVNNPRFTRHRH